MKGHQSEARPRPGGIELKNIFKEEKMKQGKKFSRLLSLLLAVVMMITMMPAMAWADERQEHGIPLVHSCDECIYYKGCEDCYFSGENGCEIDEKHTEFQKNSEEGVE